jgi:hypothetical protein
LICDYRSPKVEKSWFWDSSELQDSNLKVLLHCKPQWDLKAHRWELVLAKILRNIQ